MLKECSFKKALTPHTESCMHNSATKKSLKKSLNQTCVFCAAAVKASVNVARGVKVFFRGRVNKCALMRNRLFNVSLSRNTITDRVGEPAAHLMTQLAEEASSYLLLSSAAGEGIWTTVREVRADYSFYPSLIFKSSS